MRSRKVMKWLAAAAVGAMMLMPMTANAQSWIRDQKSLKNDARLDSTIPTVPYLMATYEKNHKDGVTDAAEYEKVVVRWGGVPKGYEMIVEYSSDSTFANEDEVKPWDQIEYEENLENSKYTDNEICQDVGEFSPGLQFVRAYLVKEEPVLDKTTQKTYFAYGPATIVEVIVPAPEVNIFKEVSENKVHFEFFSIGSSGYELQRKIGKKYKTIAKISDEQYDDKGLEKGKTYEYRVRAYAYNESTQRNVTGEWSYTTATTWGKALNVKAVPKSKKTVKLSWAKIKDADGYEIYRTVGTGNVYARSGKKPSFDTKKLIKTITKAKTTKYTDKKLDPGKDYTYTVVAFKYVNGKKVKDISISDSDTVSLGLEVDTTRDVTSTDGSRMLEWKKVIGAEGFKVEKYEISYVKDKEGNIEKDSDGAPKVEKEEWKEVNTLPGSATSVALPTPSEPRKEEIYRVYAFKGDERAYVYPINNYDNYQLRLQNTTDQNQMPSGITAVQTADGTGVTVTWNTVPGAAYYKVFRSPHYFGYNADTGVYDNYTENVVRFAFSYTPAGAKEAVNWDRGTDKVMATGAATQSVVDQYVAAPTDKDNPDEYQTPINPGPKAGHTYYYYVNAYKSNGTPIEESDKKIPVELFDDDNEQRYYAESFNLAPAKITLSKVSLKKPVIKSVQSKKKGEAKISWKKVEGAQVYYVYCSTKKSAKNYMCVGKSTKKNLTVQGLESGKTYYFKVVAAANDAAGADILATKADSSVKLSKAKSAKIK